MITYRLLSSADFTALYGCFLEAFSDYQVDMRMSQEQFEQRLIRDGVRLELSAGAFDGNRMVGFDMNASGMWLGKPTAYDAGTGVIPAYRGQGVLTQELRKALTAKVATFTSPQDDPDFPSNNTFIGSWDRPSTYAIVDSRRYGPRAVIDVLYKWGPETNYPGDERTTSFIFFLQDGAWKLDDVYTFRGKFTQAESLNQYFREK